MSGVAVIVAKLLAHAALTAVVPSARIIAGQHREGTSLPAIGVSMIASTPRVPVNPAVQGEFNSERVQVTVLAKTYPQMRQVMRLVRAACPHTRGTLAGVTVDAILPEAEGPDFFDDELPMVACSRDFTVNWIA